MAATFSYDSVPTFYRDVLDILCHDKSPYVDQDMFLKLLVKSSLPKQVLSQIWELVDNKQGYLTQEGLSKALALTALAQQGRSITDSGMFLNIASHDLPKPSLGDLSDLRLLSIRIRQEKNPSRLGLTYTEVCALDQISVVLMPEKKGLFLKHVEYELKSKRFNSTVLRRYNDFIVLYDLLLQRFPYRLVPQLPPKRGVSVHRVSGLAKTGIEDTEFIEIRRKSLKRFLNLVIRHPEMTDDKVLHFFLTYVGPDTQNKMKEHFRGIQDEFYTNSIASSAKELLPLDSYTKIPLIKDQFKNLLSVMTQMVETMSRFGEQLEESSSDLLLFSEQLSLVECLPRDDCDWGTGWSQLVQRVPCVNPTFKSVSSALKEQANKHEESVIEGLTLYTDLLQAFKDLADRHTANYNPDSKSSTGSLKKNSTLPNSTQQIENRNSFFSHCLHMETQLLQTYSMVVSETLNKLLVLRLEGTQQILDVWKQVKLN